MYRGFTVSYAPTRPLKMLDSVARLTRYVLASTPPIVRTREPSRGRMWTPMLSK
jgi:hypothetical protein